MSRITRSLRRFAVADDGAALAEYAILIAFIAILAIVAVSFFGDKIKAKFSQYGNAMS